MKVEKVKQV